MFIGHTRTITWLSTIIEVLQIFASFLWKWNNACVPITCIGWSSGIASPLPTKCFQPNYYSQLICAQVVNTSLDGGVGDMLVLSLSWKSTYFPVEPISQYLYEERHYPLPVFISFRCAEHWWLIVFELYYTCSLKGRWTECSVTEWSV